ncbi:exodeoxyribonuclease VII large subunit [Campylobacter helveticus]|uniref:Exodeoxyribonuclease 7 large subunit n=1 Tax=Campylobacter helveticus TaxID=28898 RepID=A0ABY3L1J4_9BACT|nr:exodeoxyribonuclease VII large subunit [Campylobacter helveticus]MCR2038715.1 exodeoxyribonuclease VII large subunit [Campylobacter helveticus]TXK56856.1 exodeoxyribonuclease VII large subunit [Campylobacter helveticus]
MTVSQLNLAAKSLLELHFSNVLVSGELSKITMHDSGHWYFELKDESSSIACVMFKGNNIQLNFKPEVGDFLELEGNLSLYAESGRYQFIAKNMKKEGFGDLEARFLALKESLQEEGLFDDVHKKSLPKFPLKIGIIASFSSAALEDMLKIIKQKGYFLAKIYIFNALTQGQNAPNSLINALRKADSASLDVLIMARGGGSREDLFCFNDEALAREIFAAKTPIISAIGHEIDYVISDFVADLRAPTPSAAIDILLASKEDLEQRLDFVEDKLKTSFTLICKNWENQLFNLAKIFKANSLPFAISQKMKHLENLKKQLELLMKNKIQISFLEFEKLKNAYLQHENFFEKSRHLISLKKNGKIVHLEELKSGDVVLLSSQNLEKEAKIL